MRARAGLRSMCVSLWFPSAALARTLWEFAGARGPFAFQTTTAEEVGGRKLDPWEGRSREQGGAKQLEGELAVLEK